MLDAVFDALSDAGMEIVYADYSNDARYPVFTEACSDAREPVKDGIQRAIALIGS